MVECGEAGNGGNVVYYAITDTPVGQALLAATSAGLCSLKIGTAADMIAQLQGEFPRVQEDAGQLAPYCDAIQTYFSRGIDPQVALDIRPTPFQARVWQALRAIPYGEVRSYREVAQMIGAPTAARAVARACATNPVSLVIPCHRVVRTGGALGGYGWGLDVKRALLEMERSARRTVGL